MSHYTESRSAGAFIPEEAHPQDVILHWIQISKSLYSIGSASTGCHITLGLDQPKPLFQRKRIHMMSYNTVS